MYHNCDTAVVVEGARVVLYFAYGLGPKESIAGKLFLLRDTFILGIDQKDPCLWTPVKRQEIEIK